MSDKENWRKKLVRTITFIAASVGLFSFLSGYKSISEIPFDWLEEAAILRQNGNIFSSRWNWNLGDNVCTYDDA